MKLHINYKHLAAEFVVVVVGVAVALAADQWRLSLADRAEEQEYLERIYQDLEIGAAQLETLLER